MVGAVAPLYLHTRHLSLMWSRIKGSLSLTLTCMYVCIGSGGLYYNGWLGRTQWGGYMMRLVNVNSGDRRPIICWVDRARSGQGLGAILTHPRSIGNLESYLIMGELLACN
jgi:hypothetical protein